jgi:hypothetical protein
MALKDEHKKRLDAVFMTAGVDPSHREFWMARLESSPGELVESLISFFEVYPDQMGWLKEIHERKETALKNKDHGKWKTIIEEEQKKIMEITSDEEKEN